MTVLEVIDLARDLLNERLDSTRTFPDNSSNFYADNTLLGYLNREQQIIQNHLVQAFENYFVTNANISLSVDVDEYAINSSALKVLRMEWIADNSLNPSEIVPINYNQKENYSGLVYDITGTGRVRCYAIKGDTFTLRPVPKVAQTNAIRYHFVKKLADLNSQSQVSEIPETWHEILAWGIYKRALLQQEGSIDSYSVASKEYSQMVENMIAQAEDRQIQKPRYVQRNRRRNP